MLVAHPSQPLLTPVVTVLLPTERSRVDAAGNGLYRTIHRDSIEDVIRDLKEQRAWVVLLSTTRCSDGSAGRVARIIREFPRIPTVALLTSLDAQTPHTVLAIGQSGVRTLIDVRQPSGWRELRELLLIDRSGEFERLALGTLAIDLAGAPDDCWRFFEMLFQSGERLSTVRALSRELGVVPSTLMSRFFRAGLPAPKRYLALARLSRAARLFENSGLSIANVANQLEYSSPQSFGRHIRMMLHMNALDFRRRYDGESMLQRFREELVLPVSAVLRRFSPLAITVPGHGPPVQDELDLE